MKFFSILSFAKDATFKLFAFLSRTFCSCMWRRYMYLCQFRTYLNISSALMTIKQRGFFDTENPFSRSSYSPLLRFGSPVLKTLVHRDLESFTRIDKQLHLWVFFFNILSNYQYFTFMWNSWFWLVEEKLMKFDIIRWIQSLTRGRITQASFTLSLFCHLK